MTALFTTDRKESVKKNVVASKSPEEGDAGGEGRAKEARDQGEEGGGRAGGEGEAGPDTKADPAVTWDVSQHPVNQVVGCWQQCWGLCYALRSMWMACPGQDGTPGDQRAGIRSMGVARRPEGARRQPASGRGKARNDNRLSWRPKY